MRKLVRRTAGTATLYRNDVVTIKYFPGLSSSIELHAVNATHPMVEAEETFCVSNNIASWRWLKDSMARGATVLVEINDVPNDGYYHEPNIKTIPFVDSLPYKYRFSEQPLAKA